VLVRLGKLLIPEYSDQAKWSAMEQLLLRPLMGALVKPPYAPSPVIDNVTFSAPSMIIRRAIGSDNWPITWADDGLQYTAYGDGWGFEPPTDKKLSLGFAKITGTPRDFRGENIRSVSGERKGDGPAGPKASGMLSLDGTLYMWVRNLGNAQLAWSLDHGRTWDWGLRIETSFGTPSFLNFGQDYQGARDDFVYIYSQDGQSAYESDDGVVLARVERVNVRDRSRYEFYAGLDKTGNPEWSRKIEDRAPVFQFNEHCARIDVVYNAGIDRYLMALAFDRLGGWGLFDAPSPWGPWTTAFFTPAWDLGETHGYRLPSKWISTDGTELQVVVSGRTRPGMHYDAFSVRPMMLRLRRTLNNPNFE
jgi:hypothetical protein